MVWEREQLFGLQVKFFQKAQCEMPSSSNLLHVYSFLASLPSFLIEYLFSHWQSFQPGHHHWQIQWTFGTTELIPWGISSYTKVVYKKVIPSLRSPTYSYHILIPWVKMIHNDFWRLRYWIFTIFQVPGPVFSKQHVGYPHRLIRCIKWILIHSKIYKLPNRLSGSLGKHFNWLSWHYILQISTEWMSKF